MLNRLARALWDLSLHRRKTILQDFRGRKGNWMVGKAQAMADAMEKDWRAWRERRQS